MCRAVQDFMKQVVKVKGHLLHKWIQCQKNMEVKPLKVKKVLLLL